MFESLDSHHWKEYNETLSRNAVSKWLYVKHRRVTGVLSLAFLAFWVWVLLFKA